jgi:hypothetical protein
LGVRANLNLPEKARRLGPATPEALRREAHAQYKRHTTSQYRGVFWDERAQCWRAQIQHQRAVHRLGSYGDEVSAARAYDHAAVVLHGDRAKPNFY